MKLKARLWSLMKTIGFVLVALVMTLCLARVMMLHGLSDTTGDNFFAQEEDTMDILYLGNCHTYTSMMPSVVEEITGKTGYVFASSGQGARLTYFYLQTAL